MTQVAQQAECEYMISRKREYLELRSLERLREYMFFIALSVCEHFYFSSFHPSLTWFAVDNLPFIFLSLPHPFSVKAISWNYLPKPEKLKRIQEIVQEVYHDQALTRMQI